MSIPLEYTVRVNSSWKKRLFVAICNKHGIRTYRYARQKYTTTMVRVAAPFMNLVLWPDYQKYATILDKLSEEILCDLTFKISCVKEEDETVITGEIPFTTEGAAL